MQPYSPRPIVLLEPIGHEGWRLKVYSIVFGDSAFNRPRFDGGLAAALRELPSPAKTADRPGAGFVILHQGRDVDYVVLAWWDRENELPLRVFVRERVAGKAWRAARGGESVCVWDLQVIAAERDAYVDTVMGGGADGGDGVAEYMTRSAATELTGREMLRHAIATLAYRGEQRWLAQRPGAWHDDVARFFAGLETLDEYIASGSSLHGNAEKLLQGPIADALTHVGQLTMLRRAVGHPIRGESYARADIRRGQVGAEQAAPRVEFD